nr:hypothetical protein [Tanacetum cinerariifolium]GEW68124.1 hypothetical protein [Tanacetum cinerariifolium]
MVRDCVGESDLGSCDVVGSGENDGKRGRGWLQGLSMLVLVASEILKICPLSFFFELFANSALVFVPE